MVRARLLVVLGALVLAACASADDAVTVTTTTPPAPPTPSAAAPSTAAPSTAAPSTAAPSTIGPSTAAPSTAVVAAASTTGPGPTTATSTGTPSTSAARGPSAVFRFATADALDGWRTQNDPVMGGVSTGGLAWADGSLVFAGDLSLDNGGGFASLVSPIVEPSPWADAAGVRLDVIGDGRTYVLQLRGEGAPGGWTQPFDTTAGVGVSVTLRWAGFEPVDRFLRPTRAAASLDPATIRGLAIYLVEKREGPFRLAVQAIG